MPIAFAFVLDLLLRPSMRISARQHIPKTIAALLIIFVFVGGVTLGITLSGPAAEKVCVIAFHTGRFRRRRPIQNIIASRRLFRKTGGSNETT